jgi:hypothetical protein
MTGEAEAALQDAHMDHLAGLHERGELLAAGPVADPEDVAIGVYRSVGFPGRVWRSDPYRREVTAVDYVRTLLSGISAPGMTRLRGFRLLGDILRGIFQLCRR